MNDEKKIVGTGYNAMPIGCKDGELPWARKGASQLDTKYPYGKSILPLYITKFKSLVCVMSMVIKFCVCIISYE